MFSAILDTVCTVNATSILAALLVILTGYYFWPLINPQLSHVPGPGFLPVIGNFLPVFKHGFSINDIAMIKKYGKVFRLYEGRKPTLVVADTDILKQILVKDFSEFTNRREIPLRGIFKQGLFDAVDHQWRRQRHLLTPSYTSGKLRKMTPAVKSCVDKLVRNIGDKGQAGFDAKEISGMFTMDVIASTGFGLDLDSQKDPSNPFIRNAKSLFEFKITDLIFLVVLFCPFLIPLLDLLGVELVKPKEMKFFTNFLEKTIEARKRSTTPHNDLLQMMIDANKEEIDEEVKKDLQGVREVDQSEKEKGLTSAEVLAQALLFFLAAYDTTSSTMAFMMYHLAENPDVQDKLYNEISGIVPEYGDVNYEAISKMGYLDQCVQETLRKFPPALRVDRVAARDMNLNGVFIPKGTVCIIPIYALHHQPDVWSEPDKFDPDRFTAEAKQARSQFNHLPFGLGPRQCIGMRLAMMEMKMAFVQLLSSYRLIPSDNKLELQHSFAIRAKNGVWVKAERRQ